MIHANVLSFLSALRLERSSLCLVASGKNIRMSCGFFGRGRFQGCPCRRVASFISDELRLTDESSRLWRPELDSLPQFSMSGLRMFSLCHHGVPFSLPPTSCGRSIQISYLSNSTDSTLKCYSSKSKDHRVKYYSS